MSNEAERGERAEAGERGPGRAESVTDSLRRGAAEIHERLDAGDSFERAAHGLARELADGILERADFGRELVEAVRGRVAEHRELLGEWGDKLSGGLDKIDGVVAEGSAWLRAHPQTFDAVIQVVCLALVAAYYPAETAKLLSERPDLMTEPLMTLLGGEPRVLTAR